MSSVIINNEKTESKNESIFIITKKKYISEFRKKKMISRKKRKGKFSCCVPVHRGVPWPLKSRVVIIRSKYMSSSGQVQYISQWFIKSIRLSKKPINCVRKYKQLILISVNTI